MFEGSLVESRGLIVSPAKRWTTIGSAMVQCAIAALLVAIPLTHPQLPALHPDAPHLAGAVAIEASGGACRAGSRIVLHGDERACDCAPDGEHDCSALASHRRGHRA